MLGAGAKTGTGRMDKTRLRPGLFPDVDHMADWPCLHRFDDGVLIDLHVAPCASGTQAMGLHAGALRVRVAGAAVEGQANAELLRWLSLELGVPRRSCVLLRGHSSKRKQVQVVGVDAQAVHEWLRALSVGWA